MTESDRSAPTGAPWRIAPVVALAAFMEVLDISIANVALAHIAGGFSAGQDESTWILTSYLVTNAIVLPISAWLSSVLGRKRFFMSCIAGFTLSSLACGLAPSLAWLIAFRALQGMTGGGLQPTSQAILADSFPPRLRGMAFAVYGLSVVFAPVVGPTLGGYITDNFSWRWVFLINVPVGIVLLVLSSALLSDSEARVAARKRKLADRFRVDYVGFSLLALGLGSLQVVLDRGQGDDWFDSRAIATMAIMVVVALSLFVVWELRRRDPIVDLALFRNPNFALANLLMFLLGFVLLGSTVLVPLYVQSLLGYSATDAGLVLSPGGLAVMLTMPIVGGLTGRIDTRWLIIFGLVVSALGLLEMARFNTQTDYATIAWMRVVQAGGLGFLFIPINTAAYVGVPAGKNDNASAFINLSRNLGGSVGIALMATLLARRTQFHHNMLIEQVSVFNRAYQDRIAELSAAMLRHGASAPEALQRAQATVYGIVQREAAMLAYVDAFRTLAFVFLALIPVALLLRRRAAAPASS